MRKNRMILCALCLLALALGACGAKQSAVGTWSCELYGSEQIIELTADGRFIDHTAANVLDAAIDTENRYRIKGGALEIYVEEDPTSTVTLEYHVKDDVLTLGGVAYQRVEGLETGTDTKADSETDNGIDNGTENGTGNE